MDPASVDTSDVISYRTLTRADFKAAQLPPEFAAYANNLGAATCAYLVTAPDTQIRVQTSLSRDGTTSHRATYQNLRFIAQMDRNCSWWNPVERRIPKEYILEHEQIHFAIFELEARRLNGSIPEIEARLNATAENPEVAAQQVQQQLEAHMEGRIEEILKRSREFDEDTSLGHDPEKQKRWWNAVHSELAAPSD